MGAVLLEMKFPGLSKAAFGIEKGGPSKCNKGAVDVVRVVVVGFNRGVPRTAGKDQPTIGVSFGCLAGFFDVGVGAGMLNRGRRLLRLNDGCDLGPRALDLGVGHRRANHRLGGKDRGAAHPRISKSFEDGFFNPVDRRGAADVKQQTF